MPLRIPATVTGLEASIQAAAKKAGKNLQINLGTSAKSVEGLSQPLGRITGKADQFTKSMEAANARVLAFGASVGVLSAVTRGFQELVKTTIEVEKQLASINSILNVSGAELNKFKKEIFDVARNTEQSFETVAQAALELSRQGLSAVKVTQRLNDAMVLSRLSGLGAAEAVAGLTAAINSFNKAGLTSEEVLNKLSAASVQAAVSERDLIEGIKRSASVAQLAGVSLDELVGVITAVQEKTARGGAVIGNSFKTIFTRIQSLDKLKTMRNLGVQVTDASGAILSGTKLIENLAKTIQTLPDARKLQIAENLVGKFQVAPFLAILDDYSQKTSTAIRITEVSQNATTQAYERNVALNKTLSAALNETVINVKELANTLGEIGVTDNLKNVLGFFNALVTKIKDVMEGEGIGSDFARGIVKGIGNIISGPGLAIFGAIVAKLTMDLVKFGVGSLQTFFGINKAAKEQAVLQGQIASTLLSNKGIQEHILSIENSTLSVEQKRRAQIAFFTTALNEQLRVMTQMQGIAGRIAPGVMGGTRGARGGKAAGGYIPNFDAVRGYGSNFIPNFDAVRGYGSEQANINRGVGGAPASARPVTIPNFNFGGGQRGSITANSSEFIVPNFAGSGGSAIFNQNMVSSMGLPAGAKKIGAAGGYIPNFAARKTGKGGAGGILRHNTGGKDFVLLTATRGVDNPAKQIWVIDPVKGKKGDEKFFPTAVAGATSVIDVPTYNIPPAGSQKRAGALDIEQIKQKVVDRGAGTALKNARLLSSGQKPPMPSSDKMNFLKTRFNPGAVGGMAGSIFEVSLAALLSDRRFDDYAAMTNNAIIDLLPSQNIYSAFGVPTGKGKRGAEVKAHEGLAEDAARKFYNVSPLQPRGADRPFAFQKGSLQGFQIGPLAGRALGLKGTTPFTALSLGQRQQVWRMGATPGSTAGGRLGYDSTLAAQRANQTMPRSFAGGYIPSFASPLQDAIGRERAAGLPINQIRINQDPTLRNAGNPQGLAVTNMRDEPTGAVPNFAPKPSPTAGGGAMTQASGDLMMKFMGLTMAASMLQGIFSQVGEETSNFSQGMSQATQALMMMSMMAMMGGGGFGFKPLAAGGMSKLGGRLWNTGLTQAGGQSSIAAHRLAQNSAMMRGSQTQALQNKVYTGAGAFSRVGGKVAGGALKVFSTIGRFLPVLGQVIFAFQGLSAIAKMFGVDLGGAVKNFFKDIGVAIGWVDTPAVKTAKALDKLTDAAYEAAAATGKLGPEQAKDFFKKMIEEQAKQRAERGLTEEEKKATEGKDPRGQMMESIVEGWARSRAATTMLEKSTMLSEIGQTKGKREKMGRFKFVEIELGMSGDEVRKAVNEAVSEAEAEAAKTGRKFKPSKRQEEPWWERLDHPSKLFEGRTWTGDDLSAVINAERMQRLSDIKSLLEKDQSVEGTRKALEDLRKAGDILNIVSVGAIEEMGGFYKASIDAFATKEQRTSIGAALKRGDRGASASEMVKAINTMPKEARKFLFEGLDQIAAGTVDYTEALKKMEEILGRTITGSKEIEASDKIKEKVAKARLANMIAIQKAQAEITDVAQLEQKVQMGLLDVSRQQKAEIEAIVRIEKNRAKLAGQQIEAVGKTVQSESQFAFNLTAQGVDETISAEKFKEVQDIIGITNNLIIEQRGYNEEVEAVLLDQLNKLEIHQDIVEAIVALIREEVNGAKQKNALQELLNARVNFNKKILESTLESQKRILSNMKAQLSVEGELLDNQLERARISTKITELEGQKIGLGKGGAFEIEKKITEEKEKQAKLERDAELKRLTGGFRQRLFGDAQKKGLTIQQLGTIQADLQGAETQGEFLKVIQKLEQFSKDAEKEALATAAFEKLAAIERARELELSGNVFYDTVVDAGRRFHDAIIGALPEWLRDEDKDVQEAFKRERQDAETKAQRTVRQASSEAAAQRVWDELTQATARVDARPEDRAQLQALENLRKKGLITEEEYQERLAQIQNNLRSAGNILNTFAKQVADFVYNLAQSAEDLKFQGFQTTDAMGVLANARAKDENRRLQALATQGLTPEEFAQQGIAAGAETQTIQNLRDQAFLSPTAAGARASLRQIPVMEKIFDLKAKINEQGFATIEQQQELLNLEKERLTVNDGLVAKLENAFVFSQSEIQNELTTKLVDGAAQFTKKISDGLVDAIVKGEDLGDTLRNAATEFFTGMAKAHMDAAFKQITSSIGLGASRGAGGATGGTGAAGGGVMSFIGSILGMNSGGIITGGSGSRDDVPTLLTHGEFVIRKGSVDKYGRAFMEALNRGTVDQMQRGGPFYSPGTHGQGAISGTQNLLDYATQTYTPGIFDQVSGGAGAASVSLEARSGRLTRRGEKMSVAAGLERASQMQSATLAFDQMKYEEQLREQERERKKAFRRSLLMAAASVGINQFAQGFGESMQAGQGFKKSLGAGFSGFEFDGERFGGLLNFGPRPEGMLPSARAGRGLVNYEGLGDFWHGAGWSQRGREGAGSVFSNSSPRRATGGAVPYAGGVDTVPTMLSGGEFVMNAGATQNIGRGNLATLNAGGSVGGDDGAVVDRLDELISVTDGQGETVVNITVNSDGTETQEGGGNESVERFAAKIKDVVRATIAEEQRLGGSLRRA